MGEQFSEVVTTSGHLLLSWDLLHRFLQPMSQAFRAEHPKLDFCGSYKMSVSHFGVQNSEKAPAADVSDVQGTK